MVILRIFWPVTGHVLKQNLMPLKAGVKDGNLIT
jgi:hypothetical protein